MADESGGLRADFALVPDEVTDLGKYVQQVADSLITGLPPTHRPQHSANGPPVLTKLGGDRTDAPSRASSTRPLFRSDTETSQ